MKSFKLRPVRDGGSEASGGSKKKIRRKRRAEKAMRAFKNKQSRDTALKQLKEINDRLKRKHKYKKKKECSGKIWGDELRLDRKWPNIPENKTIRIFGHNVNGVSYKNGYLDWTLMLQQLEEYQIDIAGLVEMNLDLNKPAVKKII